MGMLQGMAGILSAEGTNLVHITTFTPSAEGEGMAGYMQNAAQAVGMNPVFLGLSDIRRQDAYESEDGWVEAYFCDPNGTQIENLIKLAPLHLLLKDSFGEALVNDLPEKEKPAAPAMPEY